MPHITLLYPFLPRDVLPGAVPAAKDTLADIAAFDLEQMRLVQFDGNSWQPIGDVVESAFARAPNDN